MAHQKEQSEGAEAYLRGIGERLRLIRTQRGLSRRVLAQHSGVSERYIAQFEAGAGNMSVLLLRRLAASLGVAMEDLVAVDRPDRSQDALLLDRFLSRLSPARAARSPATPDGALRPRGLRHAPQPDRADRPPWCGQVDAGAPPGRGTRRALRRARRRGRTAQPNGVAGHLRGARAQRLPQVGARGAARCPRHCDRGRDRNGRRPGERVRDVRTPAGELPHGLGQGLARGTYEPGGRARRRPADGCGSDQRDGGSQGDPVEPRPALCEGRPSAGHERPHAGREPRSALPAPRHTSSAAPEATAAAAGPDRRRP